MNSLPSLISKHWISQKTRLSKNDDLIYLTNQRDIMCQFNNIVLPENTNIEEINKIFQRDGFTPSRVHNNSLAEQLEEKIFIISPRYICDCGSVFASKEYWDISILQQ